VSDDEGSGERTRTRTAEQSAEPGRVAEEDHPGAASVAGASDPDAAADSFLDLETRLATPADPGTDRTVGLVVDAATLTAEQVPDGYPLPSGADEALALTLDLARAGRTTTYLAWPSDGTVRAASRLGRLLAATGVPADAFADLYGRQLLVERDGEHDTLYVPAERPRGSGDWVLGVAAGLAFTLATFALAGLAAAGLPLAGLLSALVVPFMLVTLILLPWATYRDASYLRSHSDWDQGPPFWAALSMIPGLNVVVALLYLRSRGRAWFFDDEPSLAARLRRRVRSRVP